MRLTGDGAAGSSILTLAGAASIAVNRVGAGTISAVIAGSSGLNCSSTTTGTLAVANAGTAYPLNTPNNFTGILWAQSGTISLSQLPDASGNGNIKLDSGTTTGGLQWNVSATTALNLANRSTMGGHA